MKEHSGKAKVREAIVAGIFYPDDPAELEDRIESLLERAEGARGRASAILSPHAGFDYAGDLTAMAWEAASLRAVETVLVLSPLHRGDDALVYLPESCSFETPLGEVSVDEALVEDILDCGTSFVRNDIPHFEEHGVEVQLPFMRMLFPSARLVPVILGACSPVPVRALASALDLVFGSRLETTLVVISSDIASGVETGAATAMAEKTLLRIEVGDWKSLLEDARCGEGGACGSGCAAAYISSSLSKGLEARLLGRHDSSLSRESGEERLVHYAAMAFEQS